MAKTLSSVFVCVVLLGLSAFSQLTPTQQQDFNTYRLYHQFFSRVDTATRMTDRARAVGKDPYPRAGKMIQNQIGLSDQEYEIVQTITMDCYGKLRASRAQLKSAFQAFRTAHPNDPVPQDLKQQRLQSMQQWQQTVFDHMAQLRASLGDARFQQLDQWVRTSMHSSAPTTTGGK